MGLRLLKWGIALFAVGVTTASCTSADQVRQVFMALDGSGNRPRNIFYTDTTMIACDIVWVGRGSDNTLDAFIKMTAPIGAMMAAGELAATEGPATYSFSWQAQAASGGGSAPFPVGNYECDVSVNGEAAGSAKFTVEWPPKDANGHECPAEGAAVPGAACQGWVEPGSTCPSAADLSQTCTCNGASWSGC